MKIRTTLPLPLVLGALLACAGMAGCAGHNETANGPASGASTATAPDPGSLRLERVVMLMRHGVRPPTRPQVSPPGTNDRPWPAWPVDFGELTPHGYSAIRLLGQWDRTQWAARGLLPGSGCPVPTAIRVEASAKSRTQDTAKALLEGLAPDCGIQVGHPARKEDDHLFHPLETGAMPIDGDKAFAAAQARVPPGGMEGQVRAHASLFALLNHALGCEPARPACDLSQRPAGLVRNPGDRPDVGDPFGTASTISQTFLLEYLEGMPLSDVAWGRLDRGQVGTLLQFHAFKFDYEGRTPYVAARAASPLARRMLEAVGHGPKLTVLVGHDTNIADLGGLLDLHWQVTDYPRDDPPPGGAIGFETLADADGGAFVRAFYRAQTMDQVRKLQHLDERNAPDYDYLPIPGCARLCPLADFERIVRSKLVEPGQG